MNDEFQIGDIVQSRLGGSEMIIREITKNGDIQCDWFDNNYTLQQTTLKDAELIYRNGIVQVFTVGDDVGTNLQNSPRMIVTAVNDLLIECKWLDKNQNEQIASFRKEELDKSKIYDGSEIFLQSNYMPYK